MQLFVRRARAQRADLPLDMSSEAGRASLAFVADLCHRLDGLPLAIELAAAQIPFCSPQAINTMLTQAGLPLLAGGPRDHPARLQTMEASIAWSYGSLDATAQRAFRALSVFAGGFSLEAAEAVVGDDVLLQLGSLRDKSLVVPRASSDGAPRFGLLETISEYALARLRERGEEDEVRALHARYFMEVAERRVAALRRRLDAERSTNVNDAG